MSRLMTQPTKLHVRPGKIQISLGIRSVWSEYSLCAQWVAKELGFLHTDNKDSDWTGRMPRLIWVFAGRTATLLVLSWGCSYIFNHFRKLGSVNCEVWSLNCELWSHHLMIWLKYCWKYVNCHIIFIWTELWSTAHMFRAFRCWWFSVLPICHVVLAWNKWNNLKGL